MTSWKDILKKTDKDFAVVLKEPEEGHVEEQIIEVDYNIKCPDEEFTFMYDAIICDIKLGFRDYLKEEGMPFMDKTINTEYNFYDFIKFNSENYEIIKATVEVENEEYRKECNDESSEYYYDNDNDYDYKE